MAGKNDSGMVVVSLASLPEAALVDETALASAFDCDKRTVRRMVARYELPPPGRMRGRSVWRAGDVNNWIAARLGRPIREAERAEKLLAKT